MPLTPFRRYDSATPGSAEPTQIMRRPPAEPVVTVVRVQAGPTLQLWTASPGTKGMIGRAPDADLVVADPSVSRYHARLDADSSGNLTLIDLGSTNGTLHNDRPVTKRPVALRAGDRVTVGAIGVSIETMTPTALEHLKRAVSKMSAADRDALTGLVTRRWIEEELPGYIERHRGRGNAITCVFLDLDGFKGVNDTHGHAAGDRVLKATADIVQRVIRDDDVAIRFGGDEIVVFLAKCRSPDAVRVANRLHAAIAQMHLDPVEPGTITLSAGIAEFQGDAPRDWLERADVALYRAKRGGRNRTVVCTPGQ